jgi:hypothetical protein
MEVDPASEPSYILNVHNMMDNIQPQIYNEQYSIPLSQTSAISMKWNLYSRQHVSHWWDYGLETKNVR